MKILKVVRHLGVDTMLKEALGDNLTVYRVSNDGGYSDPTYWLEKLPFQYITSLDNTVWDAVIVDDIDSWEFLKKVPHKHLIWYVHGTYHTWLGFQYYANENFNNCHVLFPDSSRKRYITQWYKNEIISEITIPIHLHDGYYSELKEKRNGRVYTMGNDFINASSLYGNYSRVESILGLLKELPFDFYGYNNVKPIEEPYFKGPSSKIKDTVSSYSASVHPSQVETLSFVLLESMASGVPIITTPKVDFPMVNHGDSYVIAQSIEEFHGWAKSFVSNDIKACRMGRSGQTFLREYFPFSAYKRKIVDWITNIVC